jgi:UDP-N-acetylmuramoyl-tripeptide--D-alanyl-D-alanine ligase
MSGNGAMVVTEVKTDSRAIKPGQVFVALAGDRFDGHDFVPQVAAAGAAAVVVHQKNSAWAALDCAVVEVDDTLLGLQRMAASYRQWHAPRVLCITGSNGKTSTKDIACAVLGARYQVCATPGNLNNHIGLPLSLLTLAEGDTCGVFELGMNHAGEIQPLARIANPEGAIITNIGVAHIENLGSREAIAQEKGELAAAVGPEGFVVLNANDDFTPSIAKRCSARVVQAGIGAGQVQALDLQPSAQGTRFVLEACGRRANAFLPVPGAHMVGNATLAVAAGLEWGVDFEAAVDALAHSRLTKGRLQTKRIGGITFLDDSYNANPDSMKAGIKTLAGLECKGRRVAVLGRMGELGLHAEAGHREVGTAAAEAGLDAVITVGTETAWITEEALAGGCPIAEFFPNHEACASHLRGWLQEGDIVLLKGSRSAAMERILTLFSNA